MGPRCDFETGNGGKMQENARKMAENALVLAVF
jgi:hypothetical protein